MVSKDTYIEQLENTIKSLEQQVSNLTEMVLLLRKGKFGSSSEKTPREEISDQLSLFNEAELEADPHVPEPVVKDVNGYKRRKAKTKREVLLKDLPVKEILCEIPEEDLYCGNCGVTLKPIGKETVVRNWNTFHQNCRLSGMCECPMSVSNASIRIHLI